MNLCFLNYSRTSHVGLRRILLNCTRINIRISAAGSGTCLMHKSEYRERSRRHLLLLMEEPADRQTDRVKPPTTCQFDWLAATAAWWKLLTTQRILLLSIASSSLPTHSRETLGVSKIGGPATVHVQLRKRQSYLFHFPPPLIDKSQLQLSDSSMKLDYITHLDGGNQDRLLRAIKQQQSGQETLNH